MNAMKAKELLEEAKYHIGLEDFHICCPKTVAKLVLQALAALKDECQTCEGSGEVRKELAKNLTDYIGEKVSCPDCPKPEPSGEFEPNETTLKAHAEAEDPISLLGRNRQLEAEAKANLKMALKYHKQVDELTKRLGLDNPWHNVGDTEQIKHLTERIKELEKGE